MNTNSFQLRHIGPNEKEQKEMLNTIGVESLSQLIDQTIPDDIRLTKPLDLYTSFSDYEYLNHIEKLSQKNKVYINLTNLLC